MQAKPPKVVENWWKAMKTPMPRCCHTCDHYTGDGKCRVFEMMTPPPEFTQELDQCDKWLDLIPF